MDNQSDMHTRTARMERLARRTDTLSASGGGYTRFIRIMRLALPLAAMGIVAVLFIRSHGDEEPLVVPLEDVRADIREQDTMKNELLNPVFESTDRDDRPYKITADRAVQGEKNRNLVMLENPGGVMTLKDGMRVSMRSDMGAYRQDTQRFFLKGGVFITHDEGYALRSEEAHIDLKQNVAWSEKQVHGDGPALSLDAQGVHANGANGTVVFTGPARLVLENGLAGVE